MSISPIYAGSPQQPSLSSLPTPPPTAEPPHTLPSTTTSPHETALLKAYLEAVQRKVLHNDAGLVKVPSQSTLGQWLELYRAQVEHPVVQQWMRDQKINTSTPLSIDPFKGTLSAEVDGKVQTFSLSDTSGWGQISGPLLAAAAVIVPENKGPLRVRFGDGFTLVSAKVVANFEGITLPKNPSQARDQIRHLQHQNAFDPIPADDRVRPANSRSAHALEVQKANAAKFYSSAPQALEYKRLAVDVATHLPNTRAQAKQWAEKLIFELTGKHVDADTIYLNRFKSANTPLTQATATVTGWEHPNEEPYSSLSLPDALLKNFNEHDGVPGNLDQEAGLYVVGAGQGAKGGYGAHNQFPLTPSALMHASWKTDFQAQMTQKIDHFWDTRSEDYSTAIKGEFVYQARKQIKANEAKSSAERALQAPEHQLTREDYRLVMGAASNLPLDENSPLCVEQLKVKAPVKGIVQAHAFNIDGFASSDMLRFSGADGRQVLYMPGAEPAFLRFDSRQKLDQWVVEQTKVPKKREALLSHFPLFYRQDHEASFAAHATKVLMPSLWFTHVGDKTEGLTTLFEKIASGKLKGPEINDSHSKIEGDVFATLTTATKQRMKSDADAVIKSNSEVIRDTWLNDITVAASLLAKLAPIAAPVAAAAVVTGLTEMALGAEKSSSGDTEAERNDGASKAFDGVLNVLFSAGASIVPEDPFAASPESELAPVKPSTPSEIPETEAPQPGPSTGQPGTILPVPQPLPRSKSLIPLAQYAVADGESLIKNTVPDASGVYRINSGGHLRQFVRLSDENSMSRMFEISGRYRSGDPFAVIINPKNGAHLIPIVPGRDGAWTRAPGDGGIKWPWQRPPSPPFGDEPKLQPKISDGFEALGDPKTSGAAQFDEIFKYDGSTAYEQSVSNFEEDGVFKRKLTVSWTVEENNFEVYPSEAAQPNEHGSTPYSPNFLKDLNRDRYTVRIKQPDGYRTVELDATGSANGETLSKRLKQFEAAIPDANLRSRISEVAHQGSVAPTSVELRMNQLQEHIGFKGKDTHYVIIYDPATNQALVKFNAQTTLLDLDKDAADLPNMETTAQRTFEIRESNALEANANPYVIDKSAPFTLSISTINDLK